MSIGGQIRPNTYKFYTTGTKQYRHFELPDTGWVHIRVPWGLSSIYFCQLQSILRIDHTIRDITLEICSLKYRVYFVIVIQPIISLSENLILTRSPYHGQECPGTIHRRHR